MAEKPKRIFLTRQSGGTFEEARATAAITPGMLLSLQSTGKVAKHAVSGGVAEKAFAYEDALQGKTIADNYAADDLVFFNIAQPGEVIYAILAEDENVVIGDILVSNGDGFLQKRSGVEIPIGIALEALDAGETDITLAERRIRVRIL